MTTKSSDNRKPNNGAWIQTYTGTEFYSLDPRASEVKLLDIAHALSNKCRFAGHCKSFYSVAQHSVMVSRNVPEEFRLWGLLHDAGEAYFADIPNPIKREYELFEQIENPIMHAVMQKFGLSPIDDGDHMPKPVKHADRVALATEARDLLPIVWRDWDKVWGPLALTERVVPVDPTTAKMMFLEEYHRIID